jgi:predicted phosphoribosyltransferase
MAEIIDAPQYRNRTRVFEDRLHAGKLLSEKLRDYEGDKNAYILAIPAGGVQVAFVLATRLKIPFDLVITRKIHIPWNKEAGFGAVSWDGVTLLNEHLVARLGLTRQEIDRCVAEEKVVINRRLKAFRSDRPFPDLREKRVIIVDDGLASGFSMLTTVQALKGSRVTELVVAVPTAPMSAINLIKPHVHKIVCLNIRSGHIFAVANAYKFWYDLEDEDVIDLLSDMAKNSKNAS